jgi:hypothetical protein
MNSKFRDGGNVSSPCPAPLLFNLGHLHDQSAQLLSVSTIEIEIEVAEKRIVKSRSYCR